MPTTQKITKLPLRVYLTVIVGNRQLSILEDNILIETEKDFKFYEKHLGKIQF